MDATKVALGELSDPFAGKAHDDIGGDASARNLLPYQLHRLGETGGVVAAAHGLEGSIAAAL